MLLNTVKPLTCQNILKMGLDFGIFLLHYHTCAINIRHQLFLHKVVVGSVLSLVQHNPYSGKGVWERMF